MAPFQSTPSVWRETGSRVSSYAKLAISIHSLRVEGDLLIAAGSQCLVISIHSLRVEGDSTPHISVQTASDFNPLPPRGGRRLYTGLQILS